MKKSSKVTLTLVAALGAAACNSRRLDPCQPATFNQQACQDAVSAGGYYWNGSWSPMAYHYPYPYYYDSYKSYVGKGGRVSAPPPEVYTHSGAGVTRGGFGETGAGHGAGE